MEIRVAICDDDIKDLEKLHSLVNGYGEENHIRFSIADYLSGSELFGAIEQGCNPEIVLLGIKKYFYPMKRMFQRTDIHWMHYGWFPLFSTIVAWYFTLRYTASDDHKWFFSFISAGFIVLNIFAMSVLKRSLESEEKYEDMELKVMQKQNQLQMLNDMQTMYERQGRKLHDYKKQLSSIQELLETGETEAAAGLVGSLTNSLSVELSEVNVGNSIVNAVLYSRTQLIAVFDKVNVLELRLRVRLIGNENR
ncbi:MAG: hypothetical protein IJT16_06870 [Lachnospiraceae bacterium]|nr:hypothetical protein [Lachnospiraceae bacterium]